MCVCGLWGGGGVGRENETGVATTNFQSSIVEYPNMY